MAGEFSDSGRPGPQAATRGSVRPVGRPIALFLVVAAFLLFSFAETLPRGQQHPAALPQSRSRHKKRKPEPPLITEEAPQPAPPPTPPPKLTPEQMPPRTPDVVWDGSLLSINADNSTLSDILVAIRARTGAVIDLPPGTASERMAARLGPAPLREVLTSLLSSSGYDYIIQASDTNEDEIASVILTPRGKDDALANTSVPGSNSGIRRAPGYTASGKHTFEVIPDTSAESPAATDVAGAGEGESGQPESNGASEIATVATQAADSSTATDSDLTSASAENSDARPAIQNAQNGAISAPTTGFGQMVQNMQQMFEQRRQIQAQQNQAMRNPSTPQGR